MPSRASRHALSRRQLAPFAAAAVLAFLLVAFTARVDPGEFLLAAVLAVGVAAMALRVPRRQADLAGMAPALLFLLSAALLRDAARGVASGVGAVALLPVFWVALHGTRRRLAGVLAGVAAYYFVPIILVGGVAYPASGYRAGALLVVISGIVGLAVQRLVDQTRAFADGVERHRQDLERVAAASRQIATSADARTDVCRAACDISGANFAILLEPDGADGVVSTAMAGIEVRPFGSAPVGERSATRTVLTTRRPLFVADAASSDIVNHQLWAEHGSPASMLFEPVLRGNATAGVLVVGWADPVRDSRDTGIIGLLATEAAIAIERADFVKRLSALALTDPLTGLHNRRAWDTLLPHAIADATATGRPITIALLDLDNFKAFNDARGHQSGDRLLKEAAAAWRTFLRPGDMLARYGGEEFAILLPDCTQAGASAVIERLRRATPAGETCSAGIAEWQRGEAAELLLARADEALYAAKAGGRNRAVPAPA